ncbi:MAG: PAS domain S-box protein, partial [Deltaproteobacteria bacterium]|nr:PAS domain S-box protein [Deltaproteobacteria bacterium]
MITIKLLSYLSAGMTVVFSVWLCVYYLKPGQSIKGNCRERAAGILLAAAGLGAILNLFVISDIVPGIGVFILWTAAFALFSYETISSLKTINKIYPSSRLNIVFNTPDSVFHLIGLFLLAVFIFPISLFDLIKPSSLGAGLDTLTRAFLWTLTMVSFLLAARMKKEALSIIKPVEEEITFSIRNDVLVTRAYASIVNRFIARVQPFPGIMEEALIEFLGLNPILFQNCVLTREGDVDFKPAEGNVGRINEEDRIHQICTIFAALCWRIINLYSVLTSFEHSEAVFTEGYREALTVYRHSSLFTEILRSLPEGLLEDEKVVLLSKEELEKRVRERTNELEKARDDQTHLLEELRVAEANLRRVITRNADSMIIVDNQKRVRFVNPAAEELFEREAQNWLGQEFKFPVTAGGLLEIEIEREDGENLTAEMRTVEIEWQDQLGSLASIRDITDRKRTETELIKNREALELSNQRLSATLAELKQTQGRIIQEERLAALGQVASGIAHDFNNSLAPILGYSDLLLSSDDILDDKETVKKYLKIVSVAARDASNVVRRLREFYRKREKFELFDVVQLEKLAHGTIDLTKPKWKDQALGRGATIEVETDLQPVLPVRGNETEMREALTNLIFNAADAIDTSGRISIRTYGQNGNVVLEVSDNGSGMTREVKERCFDPFFSTKEERGTGLGLSTVYGTIERHNGQVDIDSEYGVGTTISIRIPAIPDQPGE